MRRIIPEEFARTYHVMYGDQGVQWLAELPDRIAQYEERWNIRVLEPFELFYNYVAPAVRHDGEAVVLKMGFPNPEMTSEIMALRHYAGRGIARLIIGNAEEGVILMERLQPGVPLEKMLDDEAATRIAAQAMQDLWIPAPPDPDHQLITADDWSKGLSKLRLRFNGGTGPFPAHLVERAERLYAELQASAAPSMLLHGDLHHWNILSAQRAPWLAIDPKGLLAEPAYETGAYLRNPWPDMPGVAKLLQDLPRRLAIFHEMLGLDRQRMLGWSLYQAVLSSWWTFEDHHHPGEEMIAFAEGLLRWL